MDQENGFTGTWHSWQLILWGSSIDPSIAQPHPLPGTDEDPISSTQPIPQPTPQPTVSPPHESEPSSTPSATPTPSGFWPWSSERKMVWIYGSIAGITIFVSFIGVWYAMQRRKARLLQTHGQGREDYEFEVLPSEGEDGFRAGELYDAFAGGEEYLREAHNGPSYSGFRNGKEQRAEEMDDHEMGGFLADSDEDNDAVNEKASQRLLKGKK